MNRRYTIEEYKKIVEILRNRIPNVSITTDVIVGFPGEDNNEFSETLKFLKEIELMHTHIFKYSPRKGTPAATMKNQVDSQMKNMRSNTLLSLCTKNFRKYVEKFEDQKLRVLFEECDAEGFYEGLTDNYIRVKVKSESDICGEFKYVIISDIMDDFCYANLV